MRHLLAEGLQFALMESNAATYSVLKIPPYAKVHASMCEKLQEIINAVTQLIPDIESARPGWKAGIEELCTLNISLEKGRLLIRNCAETSKLYSVIIRDATISRFERVKDAINNSLIHIQCMVSDPLATKIADVVDFQMDVEFTIDPNEGEAGNALLSLLRQSSVREDLEFAAFKMATSRLDVSSPKALLIERRSVKKLLENFKDSDKKEKILRYLLYLINKYGKKLNGTLEREENVNDESACLLSGENPSNINLKNRLVKPKQCSILDDLSGNESERHLYPQDLPPEEYICPLSLKLMYDPVIIASGQTYERIAIEAWFKEGKDICPKTQEKLPNCCMIPNSSVKKLISQWCRERGISMQNPSYRSSLVSANTTDVSHYSSISSLNNISAHLLYGEAANYLFGTDHSSVLAITPDTSFNSNISSSKITENSSKSSSLTFSWSPDYTISQSFSSFTYDSYLKFLSDISKLESAPCSKALEDIKQLFDTNVDVCSTMVHNDFCKAIVCFLKDACDSSSVSSQKIGLEILLAVLRTYSSEIPSICHDAAQLLPIFLNSGLTLEALALTQIFCGHPVGKSIIMASSICSSVIDILQSGELELVHLIIDILSELSSFDAVRSMLLSSKCLSRLVTVLRDDQAVRGCLRILADLCKTSEGVEAVATADRCIPFVAECLDSENPDEQEWAVAILLSLCSCNPKNCSLVMNEGVIPSLVDISVNGNLRGREDSIKLLQILRERRRTDQADSVPARASVAPQAPMIVDSPPIACNRPIARVRASKGQSFLQKVKMAFRRTDFLG